jgi:hypothetical protein
VIVKNAGYGLFGTIESLTDAQIADWHELLGPILVVRGRPFAPT